MRDRERKSLARAKELRRRMPDAEVILWSRLRHAHRIGMRFRRQHRIGPYIADFACVLLKIVVEVDGGTHCTDEELAHDVRRDEYIRSRGWRVLRVTNWEVYLNEVLDTISRFAPPPPRARNPRSAPPP